MIGMNPFTLPSLQRIQRLGKTADFGVQLYVRLKYMKNKKQVGEWIYDEVRQKGPVYIKLGQFISSREDIFDSEILSGVSKLQDRLQPFSMDEFRHSRVGRMYAIYDDPIATASIAQTVRGTSIDGNDIVVKLQRPDVARQFQEDLSDLKAVLEFFTFFGDSAIDKILQTLDECQPNLMGELDFKQEVLNMQTFRKSLADIPWITVPKASRVGETYIVMNYVPGIKINDIRELRAKGFDTAEVARKIMMSFIIQVLRNGIFHSDQHSGNIAIDEKNGNIIYYDFGTIIDIRQYRSYLGVLIQSLILKDVDLMINTLVQMGIIKLKGSKAGVKKVFGTFLEYINSMNASEFHVNLATINTNIRTSSEGLFTLDVRFIYFIRTVNMLEGIARTLDPKFSYQSIFPDVQYLLPDINFSQMMVQDVMNIPKTIKSVNDTIVDIEESQTAIEKDIKDITKNMYTAIGVVFILQVLAKLL